MPHGVKLLYSTSRQAARDHQPVPEKPLDSKNRIFDRDAAAHDGYIYTTNNRLSSRMALQKMFDLILEAVSLDGKRVLDVGCGDGFFTGRFFDHGHPARIVGMDPIHNAIRVANGRRNGRRMHFCVADGNRLPWPDDSFDVVILQAMLHHDDHPAATVREAFRLAPEVVILEPNGNNLGLKLIEKVSRYHREHNERSYCSPRIIGWVEGCGAAVVHKKFGGFVPIFSPDWLARSMKTLEPLVEKAPGVDALGAAVVVIVGRR